MSEQEIVWIPAVPLPYFGWRTDRCGRCGKRFRGRNRQANYELHYRREHERGDMPQMAVTRAEARRIYSEVNADSVGTTSNQVKQ